ncbi:hypothetical protein EH223_01335 [candidate division KSB1 bacterium]|nr:hypothetical protein [candidate division KSB1 bacterium]RQW06844.1 MAG: hypothetical protein EH223_01335 [candidate division KSB1 bacterium]
MKFKYFCILLLMIASLVNAQNYIGLGFTRIGVGPRQTGMANSVAGVTDDAYQMIYNPGMMGFNRNWQLSLGYNKWIAETTQNSVMYQHQLQILGSKKTTFGVGYVGFDAGTWDATGGRMPSVSAGSHMAVGSVAQRLDWLPWIGKYIAVGVSGKYLLNDLAGYSANGAVVDVGLAIKTKRWDCKLLPFFEYFQFAFGGAYQNYNIKEFTFVKEKTAIPTLTRMGASLHMGAHYGPAFLISLDINQYEGEDSFMNLGSELWFNRFWDGLSVGARAGYEFDRADDFGSGFNVGLSFRVQMPHKSINWVDARLDYANTDFGDILQSTWRGGGTVFPTRPERFGMIFPEHQKEFPYTTIDFAWEESEDPDPWDRVTYFLVVDSDSSKIAAAIQTCNKEYETFYNVYYGKRLDFYEKYTPEALASNQLKTILMLKEVDLVDNPKAVAEAENIMNSTAKICLKSDKRKFTRIELGLDIKINYYWSVIAVDRDKHTKIAHGSDNIRQFKVTRPEVVIQKIYLDPIPNLTTIDDCQHGTLKMIVKNEGKIPSPEYKITLYQDMFTEDNTFEINAKLREMYVNDAPPFEVVTVPALDVGESDTLVLREEWVECEKGKAQFYAFGQSQGDRPTEGIEPERPETIYPTPKWDAPTIDLLPFDKMEVQVARFQRTEIPVLNWVFFNKNSTHITPAVDDRVSPLTIIAKRLQENPNIKLTLKGFIDETRMDTPRGIAIYGESDSSDISLAYARAEAVRETFIERGVAASQLLVVRDGYNPRERLIVPEPEEMNTIDASTWAAVNHENRRVLMEIDKSHPDYVESVRKIFSPYRIEVDDYIPKKPVPEFRPNIIDFAPEIGDWYIVVQYETENDTVVTMPINARDFIWRDVALNCLRISKKPSEALLESPQGTPEKSSDGLEWDKNIWEDALTDTAHFKCHVRVVDLVDGQERTFATQDIYFTLIEKTEILVDQVFNIYKFNEAKSVNEIVFDEEFVHSVLERIAARVEAANTTLDSLSIIFEGHADIIGTVGRNLELSKERANTLKDMFVNYLKKAENRAQFDQETLRILDKLIAKSTVDYYSNLHPLELRFRGERDAILVGDNNNPYGRHFNRRSRILLEKLNK